MKLKKAAAICLSVSIAISGCATGSKDLSATYTSPLTYQSFDCAQLAEELQRIQARVVQLGGRLDQAAANDKAIMGVGIIIFWPALFALGGTKQQEAEYSRVTGEAEAVQRSQVTKKCSAAAPAETKAASPAKAAPSPVSLSVSMSAPAAAASSAN